MKNTVTSVLIIATALIMLVITTRTSAADPRIDALQAIVKKDNYISARKLAKDGNPYAALFLGYQLIKSASKKDRDEGVSFIFKAADQGLPEANVSLGGMYWDGREVEKNKFKAVSRFRIAAALGDPEGQHKLCLSYYFGEGVLQDYSQARVYCLLAAKQGLGVAQEFLGVFYRWGDGVEKNKVAAHMWFNLAASSADPIGIWQEEINRAVKSRDELSKEMTPVQIAEAQAMARRCRASNYNNCD